MSALRKGLAKVEVALKWDPSPAGAPPHDLDIVAAVYETDDRQGASGGPAASAGPAAPAYLVHFGKRSPDGTITLNRDSRTGQGFGFDEVMTLELDRMSDRLRRVVVGVVVQDTGAARTFGDVPGTAVRIREGWTDLVVDDFSAVADASAATVAEFVRGDGGGWTLRPGVRGFTAGPEEFARLMGAV
ncbi:TerD family protein [Streptomyces sp. NPDC048603]|uniref:TerD family protein n=1 Tax=Streptomyces sp. NPDC048603 TaxID=3365577 RepID=UPI0037244020